MSAIEGWLALQTIHWLAADGTSVSWIYKDFAALVHSDLLQSLWLAVKGLAGTVAQLALLCYGGVLQQYSKLTVEVYGFLTYRQCMLTTWCS